MCDNKSFGPLFIYCNGYQSHSPKSRLTYFKCTKLTSPIIRILAFMIHVIQSHHLRVFSVNLAKLIWEQYNQMFIMAQVMHFYIIDDDLHIVYT